MLRWIPVALLAVLLPAFLAGDSARSLSVWTGSSRSAFQGIQSTCTGSAPSSVGSHTCVTDLGGGAWNSRVWPDSTGNIHHKSRAELVLTAANTEAVNGQTHTYAGDVTIQGAPSNQKVCGWASVWQFDTNSQFAGPRLELDQTAAGIQWGVTMWTGSTSTARGMVGVNPALLGPVVFGVPHHIVATVTWSKTNGAVSVSIDGVLVFQKTHVQTQPSDGRTQYWKIGRYAGDGCDGQQTVANLTRL